MKVTVGSASVIVESPSEEIMEDLRIFRHTPSGEGEYENLYVMSDGCLVTMPGFADRIVRLGGITSLVDRRRKMPDPDVDSAMSGLHPCWSNIIRESLEHGGGIVSVPEAMGTWDMVAAILRAYPRDALADRGTPMSIISLKSRDEAKGLVRFLREKFPERDIGICVSGTPTDSDDIVVTNHCVKDAPYRDAGVFIATDVLDEESLIKMSSSALCAAEAARWGICETPTGGEVDVGLYTEGLFGSKIACATYAQAVESGFAVPITVCWIPSPRPAGYLGSASFKVMESMAMNKDFCRMLADIVGRTPDRTGCTVYTDQKSIVDRLSELCPDVPALQNMSRREKQEAREKMISGELRRVIVTDVCYAPKSDAEVLVLATCRNGASQFRLPGRPSKGPGDKSYIVAFDHGWDMHNGRPGYLARVDEARKHLFERLGFNQMFVQNTDQLPFLGN